MDFSVIGDHPATKILILCDAQARLGERSPKCREGQSQTGPKGPEKNTEKRFMVQQCFLNVLAQIRLIKYAI